MSEKKFVVTKSQLNRIVNKANGDSTLVILNDAMIDLSHLYALSKELMRDLNDSNIAPSYTRSKLKPIMDGISKCTDQLRDAVESIPSKKY